MKLPSASRGPPSARRAHLMILKAEQIEINIIIPLTKEEEQQIDGENIQYNASNDPDPIRYVTIPFKNSFIFSGVLYRIFIYLEVLFGMSVIK